MLCRPTCVGLRYGRAAAGQRLFWARSGSGFPHSVPPSARLRARSFGPSRRAFGDRDVQNPAPALARVTASLVTRPRGAGMSACRPFGYALRPPLRPRLTLGGRAFPRRPRAFGVGVSRPHLATRASILSPGRSTAPRRCRFAAVREAPLPMGRHAPPSRRFGAVLSPVNCRRAPTRPVSCYALFEWVAASEPTSWLSARGHILCHSARTLGPWRAVWAVSLSGARLSPRVLTPGLRPAAFGVRFPSAGREAP